MVIPTLLLLVMYVIFSGAGVPLSFPSHLILRNYTMYSRTYENRSHARRICLP